MRIKVCILLVISCFVFKCETEDKNDDILNLKKECINAAIIGIELDIERLELRLGNDDEDSLEIKSQLIILVDDLQVYQNQISNPETYQLPENIELSRAWIQTTCQINTLLEFDGQTKSGPFYHITGIKDSDFSSIIPDSLYHIFMYLVYPRYYPFQDVYVYIHKSELL